MTLQYHTPLYADDLRTIGIPAPWTIGMADRTRFGELDALGHINNTAYLKWFENFRVNYFTIYNVADYSGTPPRLVLKTIGAEFRKEMELHQDYVITGRTVAMRTSSFTMEYGVWSKGALCAEGHAVMVWLTDDGAKHPIPDHVRQTLITRDGTRED